MAMRVQMAAVRKVVVESMEIVLAVEMATVEEALVGVMVPGGSVWAAVAVADVMGCQADAAVGVETDGQAMGVVLAAATKGETLDGMLLADSLAAVAAAAADAMG